MSLNPKANEILYHVDLLLTEKEIGQITEALARYASQFEAAANEHAYGDSRLRMNLLTCMASTKSLIPKFQKCLKSD